MDLLQSIQYLYITKVHRVMGKLLLSDGTFSGFLQLFPSLVIFCLRFPVSYRRFVVEWQGWYLVSWIYLQCIIYVWLECDLLLSFAYLVHMWMLELSLTPLVHQRGWYGIQLSCHLHFFAAFLPNCADWRPFIIYVSLTFDVTCENWCCSWVSCSPL